MVSRYMYLTSQHTIMISYVAKEPVDVDDGVLTVIVNGRYFEVADTPENREVVVTAQEEDDEEGLIDFLNDDEGVKVVLDADDRFERDYETGRVFLRGTDRPIPQTLSDRIVEYLDNDLPVQAYVNFWKRCLLNPNPEAVKMLFDFIEMTEMPITPSGMFVGYRTVQLAPYYRKSDDGDVEQVGYSLREDLREDAEQPYVTAEENVDPDTGEVTVEEIPLSKKLRLVDLYTGQIDNSVGATPSMDRDDVVFDPSRACAKGLHIAGMNYIPKYGGQRIPEPGDTSWAEMTNREKYEALQEQQSNPVTVNLVHPADVVSVPHGHAGEKMRVCKYKVVGLFNGTDYTGRFADIEYADERDAQLMAELDEQIEAGDADLNELREKRELLNA